MLAGGYGNDCLELGFIGNNGTNGGGPGQVIVTLS